MAALLFAAALSVDGPDLAALDKAVARCDAKLMTATFSAEPQRRRAFAIDAYHEQEAIVVARRALAMKRLAPVLVAAPAAGGLVPASNADLDHEAGLIAERQQELDDARMLSSQRDQLLDLMRQQYLAKCSGGKFDAQN
ncbi:MAG: hypothetical protein J7485_13905 [Sphingobium sp.]|nr:hypothetical protein [Sphingobium sp.]